MAKSLSRDLSVVYDIWLLKQRSGAKTLAPRTFEFVEIHVRNYVLYLRRALGWRQISWGVFEVLDTNWGRVGSMD